MPGYAAQNEGASAAPAEQQKLRVFIDPETGERRSPNTDELKQMRSQARRTQSQPESEAQPLVEHKGMRMISVPATQRMHHKVEIDDRGKVRAIHGERHE